VTAVLEIDRVVALALAEQCNLVTADRRLVTAVGPALGNVVHLEDAVA